MLLSAAIHSTHLTKWPTSRPEEHHSRDCKYQRSMDELASTVNGLIYGSQKGVFFS